MDWIPNFFRRRKLYDDLSEEMRLHIEERAEQLMGEGMSRKEAERQARMALAIEPSWKSTAAKCGSGPDWIHLG